MKVYSFSNLTVKCLTNSEWHITEHNIQDSHFINFGIYTIEWKSQNIFVVSYTISLLKIAFSGYFSKNIVNRFVLQFS